MCFRSEALAAVKESIRVAQEANDQVCLQYALVRHQSVWTVYLWVLYIYFPLDENCKKYLFIIWDIWENWSVSLWHRMSLKRSAISCDSTRPDLHCYSDVATQTRRWIPPVVILPAGFSRQEVARRQPALHQLTGCSSLRWTRRAHRKQAWP